MNVRMLDKKRIPVHVAIIMDGNGRWAKRHGLPRSEGHRRGMLRLKEIVKAARELGLKFLTVYAFSTENWKRPKHEVDFLMAMCEKVITQEVAFMIKNDIRLKHIGRLDGLPVSLQDRIRQAELLTKDNNALCFQLAFNYGSRREIVDAVKRIAEDVKDKKISIEDIDEETVSGHLYTKDARDPDLLIRTSGEMRLSNFLLWQIGYAELYVTKKSWPDFTRKELVRALKDFQKRKRRFGGVDD